MTNQHTSSFDVMHHIRTLTLVHHVKLTTSDINKLILIIHHLSQNELNV